MKIEYCDKCQTNKEYKIIDGVEYKIEYENKRIEYIGKKAICKCCGNELFDEEVEEYNQDAFEKAYIKQFEIITTNQIDEITKKYNIGKRPLSLLLGWGETTISRYFQDYIPSLKKSEVLLRILQDSEEYYNYLMTNKDKITEIAYKKSKEKLDLMLGIIDGKTRLEDITISRVAKYITNEIEITPMGLQKLLYYVQVFYSSLFNKSIFISKCSAWSHGPVFGKIYYEYKPFGYSHINNENKEKVDLDNDTKSIVDNVIKYFGCYSAKTLEYFTHNEEPWLNSKDKEDNTIEKSEMKKFGEKIIRENKISSIEEIYKYSKKMYEKYLEFIINKH